MVTKYLRSLFKSQWMSVSIGAPDSLSVCSCVCAHQVGPELITQSTPARIWRSGLEVGTLSTHLTQRTRFWCDW